MQRIESRWIQEANCFFFKKGVFFKQFFYVIQLISSKKQDGLQPQMHQLWNLFLISYVCKKCIIDY